MSVAATTGAYTPLLLARVRPPAELRLSRCTNAHAAGAAGVSPPWDRETPLQRRGANARETAAGVLTNAGADAVAKPRGADAPPLPLLCATSVRGHGHTCRCNRDGETTGGLTPPLLFRARLPAVVRQAHLQRHVCTQSRDDVARDARSGGRQPAVVWEPRLRRRCDCCRGGGRQQARRCQPTVAQPSRSRGKEKSSRKWQTAASAAGLALAELPKGCRTSGRGPFRGVSEIPTAVAHPARSFCPGSAR